MISTTFLYDEPDLNNLLPSESTITLYFWIIILPPNNVELFFVFSSTSILHIMTMGDKPSSTESADYGSDYAKYYASEKAAKKDYDSGKPFATSSYSTSKAYKTPPADNLKFDFEVRLEAVSNQIDTMGAQMNTMSTAITAYR
jgi:hypothetical protein